MYLEFMGNVNGEKWLLGRGVTEQVVAIVLANWFQNRSYISGDLFCKGVV